MFVSATNESPRMDSAAAGSKRCPLGNDQVIDRFDRLGSDAADVVADPSEVESLFFPTVHDLHDMTQVGMVLGKVLQVVILEFATQTHRRQHQNLP